MRGNGRRQHPTRIDSTHRDHEGFEQQHVAADRDARQPDTLSPRQQDAVAIVDDLIDDGIVSADVEARVLHHRPSGETFDDARDLVLFHRGWQARDEPADSAGSSEESP